MTPRNLTKLLDAGLLGISLLVLLRVAGMHLTAFSAALPAGALLGLLVVLAVVRSRLAADQSDGPGLDRVLRRIRDRQCERFENPALAPWLLLALARFGRNRFY